MILFTPSSSLRTTFHPCWFKTWDWTFIVLSTSVSMIKNKSISVSIKRTLLKRKLCIRCRMSSCVPLKSQNRFYICDLTYLNHQLSSGSQSNVAQSWLVCRSVFPDETRPPQTSENSIEKKQKYINLSTEITKTNLTLAENCFQSL